MLRVLGEYFDKWRLTVNVEKTKVMEFRCGGKVDVRVRYKGELLEGVKEFSYLGLTFARNGRWIKHCKKATRKAKVASHSVRRVAYKYRNARTSFPLHLFDAMVKPVMLYGSEIWAGECNWGLMESVARQFYKSILGQSMGTVNSGVEMMLGRIRMEDEGRVNRMCYWKKLVGQRDGKLVKEAYDYQVIMANRGTECWGLGVKKELDRLGFSYMWSNQSVGDLSGKAFRKVIKTRITDQRIVQQREEARLKPSSRYYARAKIEPGIDEQLRKLHGHVMRRSYVRFSLGSTGALIKREKGRGKKCVECLEDLVGNVFVHRVLECKKFLQLREILKRELWFDELNGLPPHAQLDSLFTSVEILGEENLHSLLKAL